MNEPKHIICFVGLLCGLSIPAWGQVQWSESPQVNNPVVTLTGSEQRAPAIARDGHGGAVIAWVDNRNGDSDIYAILLDAAGKLRWTQDGNAIAMANNDQEAPAIVESPDGGFFAAWQDRRNASSEGQIFVQRFDADGQPVWTTETVAHTGNNSPPAILPNGPAGVITAAYITSLDDDLIAFQFISESGVAQFDPRGILSLNAKGRQPDLPPAVTPALNGGLLAAWADARQDTTVFAKGVLSDGSAWTAGEFSIGQGVVAGTFPVVVSDGTGGAIIAWLEPGFGGNDDLVKAARLDAAGRFVWSPGEQEVAATAGPKRNLRIATDGGSGAFLAWETTVGPNAKVYLQRIDAAGSALISDVSVSVAVGDQTQPQLLYNGLGEAIVVWEDSRNGNIDLFAQKIDTAGTVTWTRDGVAISTVLNEQRGAVLVDDGLGGAIIAWEDLRNGADHDLYAQRVNVKGTLGEFRKITVAAPPSNANWEVGSSQRVGWSASPEIDSVTVELSRDGGVTFEPLFPALPNSSPENGSVTIDPVLGPPSTLAKIRVSATDARFIFSESDIFAISPASGPELNPDLVSQARFGDTLTVTTEAMDVSGVDSVFLHYRKGGARAFVKQPMRQVEQSRFSATIPPDFVTERGVEYFVSAIDSLGRDSHTDTVFVPVRFPAGTETADVLSGSAQTAYRMISAANLLDQPLADEIFAFSNFGPYDTTSWRLFQYRNGENVERDSLNAGTFRFDPGRAFWLISSDNRTVDFGAGHSARADSRQKVTLQPGWNQVGNPFAFPVSWDDILAANDNPMLSLPFFFTGSYAAVNKLEPFQGYFVFNFDTQPVELTVPPIESADAPLARRSSSEGWSIQIEASCQQARDDFNFLGVREDAAATWDRHDNPEPPPIGEFISLSFPHSEWPVFANDYTTDYRGDLGDGQSWRVLVRTNIAGAETRLVFSGLEALPAGVAAVLVDEALGLSQDLKTQPEYVFATGKAGAVKTLNVLVGTGAYVADELAQVISVPQTFELSQNFPNPFNPVTTIRYALPAPTRVTIRVYDLLGREVVTLVNDEQKPAGNHVTTWNGLDRHGRTVASGVYLYRIVAGSQFKQTKKMVLVK